MTTLTRLTVIIGLALVFAFSLTAQTQPLPPLDTTAPVKYILDTTIGFDRFDSPRFKGGAGFAFAITDPTMTSAGSMVHNTYMSLQYDVTSKYTTTTAELVRVIYRSATQRLSLFTLVGAGAVTANGSVGFAPDGGGGIRFAPFKKTPEFGLIGAARVKQLANIGTYFAPTFGVSFNLK